MSRRSVAFAPVFALILLATGSPGRADEAKAIAAVEKLGGTVKRDDAKPGKPVTDVDLAFSKTLKDDDLKILKEFKKLEWVSFNGTAVTDAGLVHLKDLKTLKTIGLLDTAVTDKGLDHLKGLKSLASLNLIGTKVTKAGVAKLQKILPNAFILDAP